jgi:hypothetical protein
VSEAELSNQHEFLLSQPSDTDLAPTQPPTQRRLDFEDVQVEPAEEDEKKHEDVLLSVECVGEAQQDSPRETPSEQQAPPQAVDTPVGKKRRRKRKPSPQTTPSPNPKHFNSQTTPSQQQTTPNQPTQEQSRLSYARVQLAAAAATAACEDDDLESTRMLRDFLRGEQEAPSPIVLPGKRSPGRYDGDVIFVDSVDGPRGEFRWSAKSKQWCLYEKAKLL